MDNVAGKVESYLSRMGMPSQVIDELNFSGLSPEATALLGQFIMRRERESALIHGVMPEALAKYKRIRPRAATDETEDDGSPRAQIVIDGTIVDDEAKEMASSEAAMVSPSDLQAQIDALPEDADEIRVLINSPGGSVFAAMTMIDMLNDLKGAITVRVQGHRSLGSGNHRHPLARRDGDVPRVAPDGAYVPGQRDEPPGACQDGRLALQDRRPDGRCRLWRQHDDQGRGQGRTGCGDLADGCGGLRPGLHHEATGVSGTEQRKEAQTKGCASCGSIAPRTDKSEPRTVCRRNESGAASKATFFHHQVRCNDEV